MKVFVVLLFLLIPMRIWAASCDCDLLVFSPLTGSHEMPPATLKTYELENYASENRVVQSKCQNSCIKAFNKDMKNDRLKSVLTLYAQRLIEERAIGFNCTGLTTLQFPVVVKARLGTLSLGNVHRSMEVITHEEACFY